MNKKLKEFSGAAGGAGFQLPIGGKVKKRKKRVKEMLNVNKSMTTEDFSRFFSNINEQQTLEALGLLDCGKYNKLTEMISSFCLCELRSAVKKKVKEIVRKKKGGGGYILYAPNQGKKKGAKIAGEFPTKVAARRAELQRFPPKDIGKLKRMRKDLEKLRKNPEKAGVEHHTQKQRNKRVFKRKESVERIKETIISAIKESLFREEKTTNEWDDYIKKLSKHSVMADKKFQRLQKNIEKKTEKVLKSSFGHVSKALSSDSITLKSSGVSKDSKEKQTYLSFSISADNVKIEPIYIFLENGAPKIEISDEAKVVLTKMEATNAKLIRAELITVEEGVLANIDDVVKVMKSRDDYLNGVEMKLDKTVSNMSPLEITMLKRLLVNKYRKID